MEFYCQPNTCTQRGSDNGFRTDSQHRPSILRSNSSYGPDRHPMETFRPCTEANTKLNAQVKPLAPHYFRNENENNRCSMPRGVSLDRDLGISFRRRTGEPKQHVAPAPKGTRLRCKTNVDNFTTHIPRQEPGTSPSRRTVDSGLASKVPSPESSSEGSNRSPRVKGALGLFVPPGNTLEGTKGTPTYPMFTKSASVLGSPFQEVTSRFHRIFLSLEGLLGPASPPKSKNAIGRVKQLIDVDALMLLHVDDRNHQQSILHQREMRSGKTREGHVLCGSLRSIYRFASDVTKLGGKYHRLPIILTETIESLSGKALSSSDFATYDSSNRAFRASMASLHNLIGTFDAPPAYGRDASLANKPTKEIIGLLTHFLDSFTEPPLEPILFRAFYNVCYLPSFQAASNQNYRRFLNSARERGRKGHRTPHETKAIDVAKILFRLMPEAHSSALTYLMAFFCHAASPTSNTASASKLIFIEVAEIFGPSVCAPRDATGYLASIGLDPMDGESAEGLVKKMGSQILFWLLSYWDEVSNWQEVAVEMSESTGLLGSEGIIAEKPKPETSFWDEYKRLHKSLSSSTLASTEDLKEDTHPRDGLHANSPPSSAESISPRASWSSAEYPTSESPPTSPESFSKEVPLVREKSFVTRDELDELKRIVLAQQQEIRILRSLLEPVSDLDFAPLKP